LKGKKKMTNKVKSGDSVTLHYRGTLEDGTEFDSSHDREPMTVSVGSGQLIKGFDSALNGMTEGETKTVTIPATEAYGDTNPDNVTDVDKDQFPDDFEFTEGRVVPLMGPGGQQFLATITGGTDTTVSMDLNHPMAGKSLTFEIEVLTIGETDTETDDETTTS
jgi:peptidylprolyl isomerase